MNNVFHDSKGVIVSELTKITGFWELPDKFAILQCKSIIPIS